MISDNLVAQLQPECSEPSVESLILIVDGDLDQAATLANRLHNQGFRTLRAGNGRVAMELAAQQQPQLVVMDLRLPDMDGLRVCTQLADSSATCGIPIILLSRMTRPDIIRCSRAAGCEYYVRKPYDPNALLTLIQHSLRRDRRFES